MLCSFIALKSRHACMVSLAFEQTLGSSLISGINILPITPVTSLLLPPSWVAVEAPVFNSSGFLQLPSWKTLFVADYAILDREVRLSCLNVWQILSNLELVVVEESSRTDFSLGFLHWSHQDKFVNVGCISSSYWNAHSHSCTGCYLVVNSNCSSKINSNFYPASKANSSSQRFLKISFVDRTGLACAA